MIQSKVLEDKSVLVPMYVRIRSVGLKIGVVSNVYEDAKCWNTNRCCYQRLLGCKVLEYKSVLLPTYVRMQSVGI